MVLWENYYLAQEISDALQILSMAEGDARLIAGGTDLLLDLQQGHHPPVHTLVDVSNIAEMRSLEVRQDCLYIGAALPLNLVVASPLVREHAQALFEAVSLIGGPQVRNTATLGGNVAHALPAADGMIALLSLDAHAEIADLQGRQRLPLVQLFLGPGRSAIDSRKQILAGFYLPLCRTGQASAFRRVMRPQGVAIAILNMSVWLERKKNLVQDIRLAIGPAGPIPKRALATEEVLRGGPVNASTLEKATQALLAETRFRTSPHRTTEEYRRRMAAILLQEVLNTAWSRAGVEDQLTGD